MYQFNLNAMTPYLGVVAYAVGITVALTAAAIILSSLLAYPIAKGRMSRHLAFSMPARMYIELFRNVPIIVVLYLFYFGVGQLGWVLPNWVAALAALTISASAYSAEILRSGYMTAPKGQGEGACALALSPWRVERYVILPQVLRAIIPPAANHFVNILLASAVAALIGVTDMADWMLRTGASTFRYMEAFLVAAVVYVCLCQLITVAMHGLERRYELKGR